MWLCIPKIDPEPKCWRFVFISLWWTFCWNFRFHFSRYIEWCSHLTLVYLVYTSFDCDPIYIYVKRQMKEKPGIRKIKHIRCERRKSFPSHFEPTERNNFSFCLLYYYFFHFLCFSFSYEIKVLYYKLYQGMYKTHTNDYVACENNDNSCLRPMNWLLKLS